MISDFLRNKWADRLHFWIVWRGERESDRASASAKVSSIYRGEQFGSGYREASGTVLLSEAWDTDSLMQELRADHANSGEKLYHSLEVWAIGKGTQGMQAQEAKCSVNTYRDRVQSGIVMLQLLSAKRSRRNTVSKSARAIA